MEKNAPEAILLKNYQQSNYLASNVKLRFELDEEFCLVTSEVEYTKNETISDNSQVLQLDGNELELVKIKLDKKDLDKQLFEASPNSLKIKKVPDSFTLEITTKLYPQKNTALEGLYKSGGKFCTQCEAQGFRRITYFLDRPDIMATYETTIIADKEKYPILLSNGNPIEQGTLENNRHFAKWHDPFPKPSYLFALVASDLVVIEDEYVTKSSRKVAIKIFVEEVNKNKCAHAMQAIKDSMKWDEDVYGLEYDLDIFMVVAINDFNMGAMENKGLNIFNAKYVLADPDSATDQDFLNIQSVIAHEYFHNWSGNRVTCRDWFQLSLKEGFTVFRDQQFSSDMNSSTVQRIMDVNSLRLSQFPEDKSPMAHPVRPESYIEINNFYTATVYQKGAELIRMLYTILGKENFRKGSDLYFSRHDGQAVTTEDFVAAMQDASGIDLSQFKLWYSQAGTPEVKVKTTYNEKAKTFTLDFQQKVPNTPEQTNKKPHFIPIKTAILNQKGEELPCQLSENSPSSDKEIVLPLKEESEKFTFHNVEERPVPSMLRDFSSPVYLETDLSDQDLQFLMAYDKNGFNRYEAHQKLATKIILSMSKSYKGDYSNFEANVDSGYLEAFGELLKDKNIDPLFHSIAISLPQCTYLINLEDQADIEAIFLARKYLVKAIAKKYKDLFLEIYNNKATETEYSLTPESIGNRALKNICLYYLTKVDDSKCLDIAIKQYRVANNMTDTMAALSEIVSSPCPERTEILNDFYKKWEDTPLVMDKWFSTQSSSTHPNVLSHTQELLKHPKFDILNPNRVYSTFRFISANPYGFHNISGEGYKLVADYVIKIDPKNPSVASRLALSLSRWQRVDEKRQELMKKELGRILKCKDLSKDVYEIASKSLNG